MNTAAEPPTSDATPTLTLDPERIVDTIATLSLRIGERFPGSSLGRLAESLLEIARNTKAHLDEIERPVVWLRTATWLMAGLVIA